MAPTDPFESRPQLGKYAVVAPSDLSLLNRIMRLERGVAPSLELTLRETDESDPETFTVSVVRLSSVEHDKHNSADVHFSGTTSTDQSITGYIDTTVVQEGADAGIVNVKF